VDWKACEAPNHVGKSTSHLAAITLRSRFCRRIKGLSKSKIKPSPYESTENGRGLSHRWDDMEHETQRGKGAEAPKKEGEGQVSQTRMGLSPWRQSHLGSI
jgi:hypothetical protein